MPDEREGGEMTNAITPIKNIVKKCLALCVAAPFVIVMTYIVEDEPLSSIVEQIKDWCIWSE
jgi:hypothetical protein